MRYLRRFGAMAKGIYCYIDKKNDKIVYVGKDSHIDKNARHKAHLASSMHDQQQINKILQNNPNRYAYQVLWKIDNCTDDYLNQTEISYIKKYNPKFNFTEGGDGISGFQHSEETRKKISEAQKGKAPWNKEKVNIYSKETRKKMSEAKKGKTLSEETRKKMSEAHKGKTLSEETRKKISEANKGKTLSKEIRKKISENNPKYWKGKTFSEETRKKMSEAQKGKTLSEETRKKISEANKGKTLSKETRKKMSENNPKYWKGKTFSEETRKKMSESHKGENHPMYGKTHSEEARKKISESQNTTGFYRVTKQKNSGCQQGFIWRYQYFDNNKHKATSSTDLNKLKEKVEAQGLPWEIIDEEKAKKSLRENEVCT